MQLIRFALLALGVLPVCLIAANKEHEAIQRDIGMLGDDVKKLQRALEDQFLTVKTMLQQVINTSGQTSTTVVGLEVKMIERLQSLEKSVSSTVAGLGTKVDTMSDEFRRVKEDIADLNGRMGRMQTQLADIKTAVTTLREAPAPPPPASPTASPQATAPAVSAESLFQNASRDKTAGRYDLALSQFDQYLKAFPKTDLACVAQYSIGEIHMNKQDYVNALVAFDNVLERFDSSCTHRPNAQFMKARAFERGGQRTTAVAEYRKIVQDYPGTEWSTRAKGALKELGFSSAPPSQKKKTR